METSKTPLFDGFVAALNSVMQPIVSPVRELLATQLKIEVEKLVWGYGSRPSSLHLDPESYTRAEVFAVEGGIIIVGLMTRPGRSRIVQNADGTVSEVLEEREFSTVEINAFLSTSSNVEALLDSISTAAKNEMQIDLTNYYFQNSAFDGIRNEVATEELPSSAEDIQAAAALANRASRSLAVSIKSSRGLLVRDLGKTLDAEEATAHVERLVQSGIALREVVVVCGVSQTQVARVPDKKSLDKLTRDGLRCACGKPINQESPEDLITISDIGTVLLDKSRWLSILVRRELVGLGIPAKDILLECQLGSDEIDCIALVSGEIVIFELKDKEFSMGNAYSFSAKISVVNPQHSIIVTTEKVAADVKTHFSRAKRDSRASRRSQLYGDQSGSLHYVEGESFESSLRKAVSGIYQSDARAALNRALRTAIPDASSFLSSIATGLGSGDAIDDDEGQVSDLEDADIAGSSS